jgi:hypothetical protein
MPTAKQQVVENERRRFSDSSRGLNGLRSSVGRGVVYTLYAIEFEPEHCRRDHSATEPMADVPMADRAEHADCGRTTVAQPSVLHRRGDSR